MIFCLQLGKQTVGAEILGVPSCRSAMAQEMSVQVAHITFGEIVRADVCNSRW